MCLPCGSGLTDLKISAPGAAFTNARSQSKQADLQVSGMTLFAIIANQLNLLHFKYIFQCIHPFES